MATTYDATKDPYSNSVDTDPESFGASGAAVTPSDTVDFTTYPKAIVVTAAGNLVILPAKNADDGSHKITFTSAPVGFIPPYRVRRVFSTGTTASVATIDR
jgi:hypothetical protein